MWCPRYGVHGGVVEVVFVSFHPIIRSCFSMDQDTAVVGARSQENTKLRMCPTNLPDRSLMTLKSTGVVVDISSDIKYLDSSIRGTSGEFLRIIIKLTVMNHIFVLRFYFNHCCHDLKQQQRGGSKIGGETYMDKFGRIVGYILQLI